MKKIGGFIAALAGGVVVMAASVWTAAGYPDALLLVGVLGAPLMILGGWMCSEPE